MKTLQKGSNCLFKKLVLVQENDEHKYLYAALRKQSTRYVSTVKELCITSAVMSHNNRRPAGSGVAKWSV